MFFSEWIEVLLGRARRRMVSVTLVQGLKSLVIAAVLSGFLLGVHIFLAVYLDLSTIWIILIYPVLSLLSAIISVLIFGILIHLVAKLLGGKGQPKNFIGALALISAAILGILFSTLEVLYIIAALLGSQAYSVIDSVTILWTILAGIWLLFLLFRAIKDIYRLPIGKALFVIFALFLIFVALTIILNIVLALFL